MKSFHNYTIQIFVIAALLLSGCGSNFRQECIESADQNLKDYLVDKHIPVDAKEEYWQAYYDACMKTIGNK